MIIVTTDFGSGRETTETLGIARGSTIRAKHIGKDLMAGLRTLVGGELKEYSEMLVESRNEAILRMTRNAEQMGADAVIAVRFVTSQVMSGAAERPARISHQSGLACGTAVRLASE